MTADVEKALADFKAALAQRAAPTVRDLLERDAFVRDCLALAARDPRLDPAAEIAELIDRAVVRDLER